jgi:hypothetical protein
MVSITTLENIRTICRLFFIPILAVLVTIWLYRFMTQGICPNLLTTTDSYAHEISRHHDRCAAKLGGLGRHGDQGRGYHFGGDSC